MTILTSFIISKTSRRLWLSTEFFNFNFVIQPELSTNQNKPNTKLKKANESKILTLRFLSNVQCQRMARPIDPKLFDITKLNEIKPKEKSVFDRAVQKISNSESKNLILGTVSGWVSGVILVRVGKVAAFGLGGGVILLHFASQYGYISVNWERVKELGDRSQTLVESLLRYMRRNSCYSVGFVGGFFFGVAST
ncbi:FUN14 domain-containing protein 1-like [Galleria mellonella]|uniref:FUN14 domain-containing protein 1-like n=1 Tax=Galleria mellonella TaxID=7137 RepID=A0A6J3C2N0_GALME|nr:FUN14 domain-containing protein 1-like [Galleria mellonella]